MDAAPSIDDLGDVPNPNHTGANDSSIYATQPQTLALRRIYELNRIDAKPLHKQFTSRMGRSGDLQNDWSQCDLCTDRQVIRTQAHIDV